LESKNNNHKLGMLNKMIKIAEDSLDKKIFIIIMNADIILINQLRPRIML